MGWGGGSSFQAGLEDCEKVHGVIKCVPTRSLFGPPPWVGFAERCAAVAVRVEANLAVPVARAGWERGEAVETKFC